MTRNAKLGIYAVLGYCAATAISATWVSFSFTRISGPALAFVTFVLAQTVYLVMNRKELSGVASFAVREWKGTVVLNILTLSSWLFMFMALQRLEASVESAVFQAAVAIMGFALALSLAGERYKRVTYAGLCAAIVCLALLVAARLAETASTPVHGHSVGEGLILALVAGSTGGCYIFYSSSLHRRTAVPPTTILCIRFALLIVVAAALSAQNVLRLSEDSPAIIGRLIALSISFVVLPTFLLQFAIANLPAVRVSVLTPLVPVIALGSEYAVRPWGNAIVPVLVVLASISIIFTNGKLTNGHRAMTKKSSQSRKESQDAAAAH
jgi:drug/metabolite transporter (DMT)-like permease